MTTARVRCGGCGPQTVFIMSMTVVLRDADGGAHYAFRCPQCDLRSTGPLMHRGRLSRRLIDELIAKGAVLRVVTRTPELDDPDRLLVEPIDLDEQLDLHLLLDTTDLVVELMESA